MKNGGTQHSVPFKLFLLLLSTSSSPLYAQAPSTPSPAPTEQAAGDVPWHLTQRDYYSQLWESSVAILDSDNGSTNVQIHSFVELGSGINFLDENGTWQSTRPELQLTPQGYAIGQAGPHQLIVEMTNLNSATAIDFLAYDGARLRLGPVAIAWFDPLLATNYTLAVVQDCAGELTATNQVTFPNCFQGNGLRASIRVSYLKAGISQDLLLHEVPDPSLMGFSKFVRLELYTELTADSPVPAQNTRVVQSPSNDELAQTNPDAELLMDSFLDWGAYKMPAGSAFELNGNPGSDHLLVAKRYFVTPDQRPILLEAIQWSEASSLFARLGPSKNGSSVSQEAGWKPAPLLSKAAGERGLQSAGSPALARTVTSSPKLLARAIPPRQRSVKPHTPIQEATNRKPGPGRTLLADWSLVTGPTNFTLAGNKVFFISSSTHLYGKTVLEAGTICKFTNVAAASGLFIDGTLDCQTLPGRPALFTSQSDDVGEKLPWSTSNPWTNYCGDPLLQVSYFPSNFLAVLHDLRVSHAEGGISFFGGYGHTGSHLQFVHDQYPIKPYYSDNSLRNLLIYEAETAISGSISSTVRVEHLTANIVNNLATNSTVFLTNSLLVAVTNAGTYVGANNASNSDPANVFTTVGGAGHYLLPGSPNVGQGTPNVAILSDLRTRTVWPPTVFPTNVTIGNTNVILTPQVARDTDPNPTLGWHYFACDFMFGSVLFTNSTILITNSAVIGTFCATSNSYGIGLGDNATLVSDPSPNLALNQILRFNNIQEQANTNWTAYVGPSVLLTPLTVVNAAQARFRGTDWSVLAAETDHFRAHNGGVDSAVTFNDCQFHGGSFYTERAKVNVTNCLFERVALTLEENASHPIDPTFRYCTFFGGTNFPHKTADGTWTFKDNLFDQVGLYTNLTSYSHDYNCYPTNSSRFQPPGAHDVILLTTNVPYQTGWLGRFYIASNSLAINASSAYATNVGLFHYCCTTNNYKETNTIADIGFHVLAVNTNGLPFDADADGLPDAFENWHGTGSKATGESDWQNAYTQTNGLNDLQVWELSSNVQVNDPWQDAGSVTNTQFETTLLAFGKTVISAWVDTKLGVTGYGEVDSNDICAWFPPTNAIPQFIAWAVSHDGGVTFAYKGAPPILTNSTASEFKGNGGDPVLARDSNSGNIYLIGTPQRPSTYYPNGTNNPARIYVPFWRSSDNGETFLPPIDVFPGLLAGDPSDFADKPAMVVDNFPGTGQGDIYAAMHWNSNAVRKIIVTRADPGGTNWQVANVFHVLGNPGASDAAFLVKTNHDVCLLWFESTNLMLCTLTNRGTGCTSPATLSNFNNQISEFGLRRANNSIQVDYFNAAVLVNASPNPVNNDLYLVYHTKATNGASNPNIY